MSPTSKKSNRLRSPFIRSSLTNQSTPILTPTQRLSKYRKKYLKYQQKLDKFKLVSHFCVTLCLLIFNWLTV